jgi:hypothetical protein
MEIMLEDVYDEVKWKNIFNPPNKKVLAEHSGKISKLHSIQIILLS